MVNLYLQKLHCMRFEGELDDIGYVCVPVVIFEEIYD